MSKTEAQAAGGMGLSPADEVKQAVTGFVTDFKHYRTEIDAKLQQTEERLNMLDRKTHSPQRTPLGGSIDARAPHRKAFNAHAEREA